MDRTYSDSDEVSVARITPWQPPNTQALSTICEMIGLVISVKWEEGGEGTDWTLGVLWRLASNEAKMMGWLALASPPSLRASDPVMPGWEDVVKPGFEHGRAVSGGERGEVQSAQAEAVHGQRYEDSEETYVGTREEKLEYL